MEPKITFIEKYSSLGNTIVENRVRLNEKKHGWDAMLV